MAQDTESLAGLLDLDGQAIELADGHWVKFEVRQVRKTDAVPHGIRYSLTLHRPDNTRILGFDNAHAIVPPGSKFKHSGQKFPCDHRHRRSGRPLPYVFRGAGQLLADFWEAVDAVLLEETSR